MLPTLQAFAYYGGSGLGGNVNPLVRRRHFEEVLLTSAGPRLFRRLQPPWATGNPLHQLVNATAPDKGIGLTLSIPLRNRLAQSNQVRAELEYRQAQVRQLQLENQVRIEVRNAQFDVKQNHVAVQAAQSAVDLARQTLDADQQKLKVGLTTQTAILQDAATLTTGESNLVSAKAAYEKSRIELDRATGLLLDHAGIDVADATRGQVTHLPNVPYVAPRQDAAPAGQPSAPPAQPTPPALVGCSAALWAAVVAASRRHARKVHSTCPFNLPLNMLLNLPRRSPRHHRPDKLRPDEPFRRHHCF